MEINVQDMSIVYDGSPQKIIDMALKLAYKDANSVVEFFNTKTNGLPRSFRTRALRTILNDYVKIAKELSLTSELLYRLNWYPQFSEYQLFKFYTTLSDLPVDRFDENKLAVEYRTSFWTIILVNADKLGMCDNDVKELLSLGESHQPFLEYNSILDAVFYDYDNSIDVLPYEEFRDVLFKSSTIVEVREIASKYQINVPKRLTREQLLTLIIEGLKRNNMYDDALGEKLADYKVVSLQRFAKNNNIKASTELKKEEVIDYIINVAVESDLLVQKPCSFTPIVMSSEEFEMKLEYIKDIDDVEKLEKELNESNNIVTAEVTNHEVDNSYFEEQFEKLKKEQEILLEEQRILKELSLDAIKRVEEAQKTEEVQEVEQVETEEVQEVEQVEEVQEVQKVQEVEQVEEVQEVQEVEQVEEVQEVQEVEEVSQYDSQLEEDEMISKELQEELAVVNKKFDLLINHISKLVEVTEPQQAPKEEVVVKGYEEELTVVNKKFDLLIDHINKLAEVTVPQQSPQDALIKKLELELKILELSVSKPQQPASPVTVNFNYPESVGKSDVDAGAAMLAAAMNSQSSPAAVVNVNTGAENVSADVTVNNSADGTTVESDTPVEPVEGADEISENDSIITVDDEGADETGKKVKNRVLLKLIAFVLVVFVIYAVVAYGIMGAAYNYSISNVNDWWAIPTDSLAVKIVTFNQPAYADWIYENVVKNVFAFCESIVENGPWA